MLTLVQISKDLIWADADISVRRDFVLAQRARDNKVLRAKMIGHDGTGYGALDEDDDNTEMQQNLWTVDVLSSVVSQSRLCALEKWVSKSDLRTYNKCLPN